jgi:hypothetical protein
MIKNLMKDQLKKSLHLQSLGTGKQHIIDNDGNITGDIMIKWMLAARMSSDFGIATLAIIRTNNNYKIGLIIPPEKVDPIKN